jgi:hypothetical protein
VPEAYTPNDVAQIKVDWAMETMRPIIHRLRLHPANHWSLEGDSEQAADVLIALLDLTKSCRPEARRNVGTMERLARQLVVHLLRRRHEVERFNAVPAQALRPRTADRVRPRRREGRPTIRRRVARRRTGDSRDPSGDDGPHRRRPCDGDDDGRWTR